MELKHASRHHDDTKPRGWTCYENRFDDARLHTDAIVRSVRDEIADILCGLMDLDNCGLPDALDHVRELAKVATQKPAAVAVETADERRGREEFERFWNKESHATWESMHLDNKKRWIAYAATVQRPKVSPGQRLREAVEFAAGHCGHDVRDDQWEKAALELGIKECDA